MSDLFVYLIKVNIALIIFCLGYYLVLRHLTFYVLNRVYLVCAIVFATLYPLVDFSNFLNSHEQIARPVQLVIVNWQKPVVDIVQHDKWYWMGLVFWAGVLVMAVRFTMQLVALYRLHKESKLVQLHQYWVRIVQGEVNPFSFWKSIYVNPDNHDANELKAILAHEQVHVNQWHTVDIILGELSTIFYWFNPGVWLMKRAIRENIEFITDQKILQSGSDPKEYQYSLLNVSLQGGHNAIVNHFNVSTIKKRIMMMNSKRSSPIKLTRYAFLVPAVIVLVLIFSISKAELKKTVIKGNAAVVGVIKNTINEAGAITEVTIASAKRNIVSLPDAVQKFIVSEPSLKLDTPKKNLASTAVKNEIVVTGYGLTKSDTITRILSQLPGIAVNNDGALTKDGQPINSLKLNGKSYGAAIVKGYGISIRNALRSTNSLTGAGVKTVYIPTNGNNIASINFTTADTPKTIQNIRIRNFSDTEKPLFVVDGIEKDFDTFNVNPNDIESVSVLKDESATSSYGNKGKNGVILVTTKKGAKGTINIVESDHITVVGYPKPNGLFADKLLVIDGKESTATEANKIPADKIKEIKMINSGDKKLEKYGNKAKNGALIITTK